MTECSRPAAAEPARGPIRRGTPEFRRAALAIFAGGFGTFSLLYSVQALLPLLAEGFGVSPAASSLALSATTGALSVMLVVAGTLSESFERRSVMTLSLVASALLTLACAVTGDFDHLLVLRFLTGIALSGLPALLMAYVGEEIATESMGYAIGLSIGGNAFGGMSGRVAAAAIADLFGWRWALGMLGAVGLVCAALFWRALPPSRHFRPRPFRPRDLVAGLGGHLAEPGLRLLFLTGFLLMGSFVTLYNYVGFRLQAPPFGLSPTEVGALFTVYLVGITASTVAGSMADRYGRRRVLWIGVVVLIAGTLLTLSDALVLVIAGVAVVTAGFFGAHSVASSWVTRRALTGRAQAASLYLFFYYVGSSVIGTLGGVIFADFGWGGVVALLVALQLAGLGVAARLARLQPIAA